MVKTSSELNMKAAGYLLAAANAQKREAGKKKTNVVKKNVVKKNVVKKKKKK